VLLQLTGLMQDGLGLGLGVVARRLGVLIRRLR
jgi:hypothetical protein